MTGHIYRDDILEQYVRLFRGAMGAEFLFMDANARPHSANIVDECLQSEDITCMDWPAYSPDLNLIEHVWDMLGRRIAARQPPPTCLPELRRALLDEWCNISQDQIDNLILSMPRCFPIGLTWEHDILVLKPSPCLHNGNEVDDWMGLDEWNSWLKSQVEDSNRSQEIVHLNKLKKFKAIKNYGRNSPMSTHTHEIITTGRADREG
ncbi:transposable element Tcb1 transposase [Trichonephila clavipes]|nr:transposable element Tcb1 transposase [Trichonephila clavipes]